MVGRARDVPRFRDELPDELLAGADPARAATVPAIPPDRTNPTEAARTRNF